MPSLVMMHVPAQELSFWVLDEGRSLGKVTNWGKLEN